MLRSSPIASETVGDEMLADDGCNDMTEATDVGKDGEEELDSFERFNRAQGAGSMRSPYGIFAELRKQGGMVKINPAAMMGGDPNDAPPDMPEMYTAVGFDAVAEVLRDGARFSSRGYELVMGPVMGHSILEMDAPEHGRVRSMIQQAFTKKAQERWEHDVVRPVIDGLIDRFESRGEANLVRELTFPFPVTVIARMIGVPQTDQDEFHRLAIELISVSIDPEVGMAASVKLRELFARLLAERRRSPEDDLISVLAAAKHQDGSQLEDDLIYAFLRLLAPAGAETTYRSSSNLLFGLLSHPAQLDAVRADRSLIPQAIEEGLRWECPLTGIMRTTSEETTVDGVVVPKDQMIFVNLGAANHDESRWEDPEAFDIFRPAKAHMAFAFGPHRCLGIHLATMETRVLLERLFDRLPKLRLDPAAQDVHITGMAFRSPLALPVRFD
jgi:cytochrome P450